MTRDDIRIRIMQEALDCADRGETEAYNSIKVMCSEVLAMVEEVVKAEREACAKVCEEIKCGMWEGSKKHRDTRLRDASDGAGACTYAIRARGET